MPAILVSVAVWVCGFAIMENLIQQAGANA